MSYEDEMNYQLFDIAGNEVSNNDLQNRSVWYVTGLTKEQVFVETYGQRLNVIINPDKLLDPTVPDLLHNGALAELKTQNTPYFFARQHGMSPDYAFTMNVKDAFRYGRWGQNHANLLVYFWISNVAASMKTEKNTYSANVHSGVWVANFHDIERYRLAAPIIRYQQRGFVAETDSIKAAALVEFEPRLQTDEGVVALWAQRNASCSYVFDLRNEIFQRLI